MLVYRTDIEKALDELISHEAGMKFQALAVVLAKQKWRDLIACERKWDQGLDAYSPASLAQDGKGKGLACSLTATLKKIVEDATKVQTHFPDVRILIFSTPQRVTNHTAKIWARQILEEFNYELVVVPREELITSLLDSRNAAICQTHLGIVIPLATEVEALIQRSKHAAAALTSTWLEHPRLSGRPLIDLHITRVESQAGQSQEFLPLTSIGASLSEGRRIILEAPAGRGKTTTLIQLANTNSTRGGLVFLIDLPAWINSGLDIFSYLANMPAFRTQAITANNLAEVSKARHFSFVFNGWNEVSEVYSEKAVSSLRELERNHHGAGIIVATRSHHISPPLPGAFRLQLLPVTPGQRSDYLWRVLDMNASELERKIVADPVLDDLTRTPFILAEVTTLFRSGGEIPRTKLAILQSVISLQEQLEGHSDHLQRAPLFGLATEYLTDLAVEMTTTGSTVISEETARAIIASRISALIQARQITSLPEPKLILGALCAHHIFERFEYPSVSFRFVHQQFQEFYSAQFLNRQLSQLVSGDVDAHEFTNTYVNEPVWEEPLRMVAHAIGDRLATAPEAISEVTSAKNLIDAALIVDPIFASALAHLCGPPAWKDIARSLSPCLRAWYKVPDKHHKQCALAGMLATGSFDFSDIVIPLLSDTDTQISRSTYRAGTVFYLSSLGSNWRDVVGNWSEAARIIFIQELSLNQSMSELPMVLETLATTDPSDAVRREAIEGLAWIGSSDELERCLKAQTEQAFCQILEKLSPEQLPASLRHRAFDCEQAVLVSTTDPISRLRLILRSAQFSGNDVSDHLQLELTRLPPTQLSDNVSEYVIKPALRKIALTRPTWVGDWVARRLVEDSLGRVDWSSFVTALSRDLEQELLEMISSHDLQDILTPTPTRVLALVADQALATATFLKLCDSRRQFENDKAPDQDQRRKIIAQLENLFQAFTPDVRVAGVLDAVSDRIEPTEFAIVLHLLGGFAGLQREAESELRGDLRDALRQYLKKGVPFALEQDDFRGELKAYLAITLARFGLPEDLDDLRKLLYADIERYKKGRAALSRGERTDLAKGGSMSYANWHVRALVSLDPETAGLVLLDVLNETEYEADAASGLLSIALASPVEGQFGFKKRDYGIVWEARAGRVPRGFNENSRRHYALALKTHILKVFDERSNSPNPSYYDLRLIGLGRVLAALLDHRSIDLILQLVGLPGKWHEWRRVEVLETLLFTGVELPTTPTLNILNPIIEYLCGDGRFNDQNASLLTRCLALLAFVDSPSIGVNRIKEALLPAKLAPYELRELIPALGASNYEPTLSLLEEIVESLANKDGPSQIAEEWIDAVAALRGAHSTEMLLRFIDPTCEDRFNFDFDSYVGDVLASHIAELAQGNDKITQRVLAFCDAELSQTKRTLLAKLINRLGTSEAVIVGLKLIDDAADQPVPFHVFKAIQDMCLEQRPYNQTAGTFVYVPQGSTALRAALLDMALQDDKRKLSALGLLGQIEVWRIEYGRPTNEPRHPALHTQTLWPPLRT